MLSSTTLLNTLVFIKLSLNTTFALLSLPLSPSYSYHYSRTALSSSATASPALNNSLIDWLILSGCNPSLQHSVRIDTNELGVRGLFAQRDIAKDEVIFDLPNGLALEVGDTLKDGASGSFLIGRDLDGVDCESWDKETIYDVYQALILLNRKQERKWDSYICNLQEEPVGYESGLTPDFWPNDLIQELEIPSLIKDIVDRKEIVKIVAEKNGVDEHQLRWATWMIRSRRFSTYDTVNDPEDDSLVSKMGLRKVEQVKGFLLPLIDMANHANDPNAEMEIKVNKWTRKFDETSSFALRALKPIAKDEEISISYGDGSWTCVQMMDKYGFFLEDNHADGQTEWRDLDCVFSSSLEEDEKEVRRVKGSRRDMLSLRLRVKQLCSQRCRTRHC